MFYELKRRPESDRSEELVGEKIYTQTQRIKAALATF
jgi:hypothetical protein